MQGRTPNFNKLPLIVCLLMFFLTCVFHVSVSYFQIRHQKQFSNVLLNKAEHISADISSAINAASQISSRQCDTKTINKLRVILANYEYVHDLGLIRKGKVKCSANWGKLDKTTLLTQQLYNSSSGYDFAAEVAGVFPVETKYDVTKRDDIIAFTVNKPFKHIDELNKHFEFKIISKNKEYVFHHYETQYQFNSKTFLPTQQVETCSTQFSYCVVTENNRPGILYFPLYISVLIICMLGLISFLIAYSLSSYFDMQNSMEFRLRSAIKNAQLYLEYQPIIDVKTNKIIGVESLVRWKDEIHGQVSPELFLGVAEQLSLYPMLAYECATKALQELAPIMKTDHGFSVAINVNAYEIENPEFLDYLHQLCSEYELRNDQVKIEITERIGLPLTLLACFALKAKKYGFKIALDDFGTGVSNLVWLTEINFDVIKIDKVFTQSITDGVKQKMILAIMSLVSELNRTVIFEGVETVDEYNFIESHNEDYQIQGWYFYKSLSLQDLQNALVGNDNAQTL